VWEVMAPIQLVRLLRALPRQPAPEVDLDALVRREEARRRRRLVLVAAFGLLAAFVLSSRIPSPGASEPAPRHLRTLRVVDVPASGASLGAGTVGGGAPGGPLAGP
jgi:hypothetical protein